ncbi:unnamed protein product [Strongylus vulgaris]|uniref:Uncharacterized protein n=1 Tax=Strongylus vulgaris TaxID=40348 RepID=A0A3P7JB91_STRVU|nr:unnamed protein product [Strongylus vulgaris]
MDVLNTLLKYAQMPGNHALFTAITPSLGHIVPIFPSLAPLVSMLLLRISSVTRTQLTMNCLDIFPSLAPLVSMLLLRISSVTRTQLTMNCLDVRPKNSGERKLANVVERVLSSRLKVTD